MDIDYRKKVHRPDPLEFKKRIILFSLFEDDLLFGTALSLGANASFVCPPLALLRPFVLDVNVEDANGRASASSLCISTGSPLLR